MITKTFKDPLTGETIDLTITSAGVIVGETVLSNEGLTEFIDQLTEIENDIE